MLSNRLAFAALAIACIGAAAGGGYLATRQNTVPTPAAAQVSRLARLPRQRPARRRRRQTRPPCRHRPAAASAKAVDADGVAARRAPARASEGDHSRNRLSSARARSRGRATVARRRHDGAPRSGAAPAATGNSASQPPCTAAPVVDSRSLRRRVPTSAPRRSRRARPSRRRTRYELVVSADSVIGLQTETRVSSETARVEDRVEARVTRDVRVGDHVAIPAGSRAIGSVMQVDRGGKVKERAQLGIRFHTLVLADGTRMPISTETIYRDGEPPGNSSSSKIGGAAVGGAILGAILGGGKGAAIGAAAGAGAGGAAVAASDRNAATLPAGTAMTVRILQPITVSVERE